MRVLLSWTIAQILGATAGFFIVLRDEYRTASQITFDLGSLAAYADRLTWIGFTLTGFVIFDFTRRATDGEQQELCIGSAMAWLVSFSAVLAIVFAITFGMLLMSDLPAAANRIAVPLLNGYSICLLAALLISLGYVLPIEWRLHR